MNARGQGLSGRQAGAKVGAMFWRSLILLVLCAIIALNTPMTAFAASQTFQILPPNQSHYGKTYAQWSAAWWQWAFSLPIEENPFFDQGGDCFNGANGQSGPVWFLTGVVNVSGVAKRNCHVPAGKALFFPVINTECSTVEPPPYYGRNENQLRRCVEKIKIGNVYAEIDGVAIQDLDRYVVESPMFTFSLPENNVLGVPAGTGQSVANGYYLMLAPLSPGEHNLHFGGTYPDYNFTLDISYHLIVDR